MLWSKEPTHSIHMSVSQENLLMELFDDGTMADHVQAVAQLERGATHKNEGGPSQSTQAPTAVWRMEGLSHRS